MYICCGYGVIRSAHAVIALYEHVGEGWDEACDVGTCRCANCGIISLVDGVQ